MTAEEIQKKNQLEQLNKDLRDKGVNFKELVVLSAGGEQYLGECANSVDHLGRLVLFNPKRFARMEFRHPQNPSMIMVDFMIGDIDFISQGEVSFTPDMEYFVDLQDLDCQINMAKLYLEYFDRKMKNKALESGLTLPETKLIKG